MRLKLHAGYILLGLIFFVFGCKEERSDRKDFKLSNTEEVDKIFISKKNGGHLTLEKIEGEWKVNGKYNAYYFNVSFLLDRTLSNLSVKSTVPKAALDHVMKDLAVIGTKVEVYKKGEKHKVYYVGGNTNNLRGTYMMLEGAIKPYIVHIPGFEGYLSSRFPVDVNEWIDRTVIDVKPDHISEISVSYPNHPEWSFTTSQSKEGSYRLFGSQKTEEENLNLSALRSFYNQFEKRNFEGIPSEQLTGLADSMVKTTPYVELKVVSNEQIDLLKVFRKPSYDKMHGLYDKNNNEIVYDPERYFAIKEGLDKTIVVQHHVFRYIFIKKEELLQPL